jgi:hypothetical protein
LIAVTALAWLFSSLTPPPLPRLLQNARQGGGWWGACPPRGTDGRKLALSPELNVRVAEQFPPGTWEETLVKFLSDQGFGKMEYCEGDTTIRFMSFATKNMGAWVFWKVDENRILWTKGFVSSSPSL